MGVWFPLGNWFVTSAGSRAKLVFLRNHTRMTPPQRQKVRFPSGDTACAAAIAQAPLAGPRGTVASLTTPDAAKSAAALDPDNQYPDWEQTVAAGSALRIRRHLLDPAQAPAALVTA
jgi:hypothetical protein